MTEVYSEHVESFACPSCKKEMDAISSRDGRKPEPGDLSICLYCGAFLRFLEGHKMEPLPPADFNALPAEQQRAMNYHAWCARILSSVPKDAPFPPSYYLSCEIMALAARHWLAKNPCVQLTWQKWPKEIAYIGSLSDEPVVEMLACNDHARELLRFMNNAVEGQGTALMARAVLDVLLPGAGHAGGAEASP